MRAGGRIHGFRGSHSLIPLEINQFPDIHGRFVRWRFPHIRHPFEVLVRLRVSEGKSARSVFTVFQRLDVGDSASVASQAADGKIRLFEQCVQLFAVQRPVYADILFQMVLLNDRQDFRTFPFTGQRPYDMEINLIFGIRPVILRQSAHEAVESVP